jgi:hypothetical protein
MRAPTFAQRLASQGDSFAHGGSNSGALIVGVSINNPAASAVLTIFGSNPSLTTSKIATLDCGGASGTSRFIDLFSTRCKNGFQMFLTGGNADVTVYYS